MKEVARSEKAEHALIVWQRKMALAVALVLELVELAQASLFVHSWQPRLLLSSSSS